MRTIAEKKEKNHFPSKYRSCDNQGAVYAQHSVEPFCCLLLVCLTKYTLWFRNEIDFTSAEILSFHKRRKQYLPKNFIQVRVYSVVLFLVLRQQPLKSINFEDIFPLPNV